MTLGSSVLLFVVVFVAMVAAGWVTINVLIPQKQVAEVNAERDAEQKRVDHDYESLGEGSIPQDLPKLTLDFASECVEKGEPLPAQWLGVLVSYDDHKGIFRSDATLATLRSFWEQANLPYVQAKLGPAYKSTLNAEYARNVIESGLPSGDWHTSGSGTDSMNQGSTDDGYNSQDSNPPTR